MQNVTTACSKCSDTAQATTGWEVQETIEVPSFINCHWCDRRDVWDTRTIMRRVKVAEDQGYQVGDQVYALNVRQTTSRMGARHTTTRRHMEVAQVGEDRKGRYYRLRKPGTSSRGGQVRWREKDLEPVEG